jgi:hypothetical protein
MNIPSFCEKHRTYKGKLMPRCDCLDCWKIFSVEEKKRSDEWRKKYNKVKS